MVYSNIGYDLKASHYGYIRLGAAAQMGNNMMACLYIQSGQLPLETGGGQKPPDISHQLSHN